MTAKTIGLDGGTLKLVREVGVCGTALALILAHLFGYLAPDVVKPATAGVLTVKWSDVDCTTNGICTVKVSP